MSDDCISRQQVLDFFKDDVYVCNEVKNMARATPKNTVSVEAYKQVMWERDIAIQQLNELGYEFGEKIRTGKWIPVSDRFPEKGEEVLISAYDTYNKRVIISRYQGEQYGFTCDLVISAWMPLPEPYKAESEE